MKQKTITSKSLEEFESVLQIHRISSETEFNTIINLEKVMIYLLVDWSGSERLSRYNYFTALSKITEFPNYIIDCSLQKLDYLTKWLKNESNELTSLCSQGNGEILLIKNSNLIDLIKHPHQIGVNKTKKTILSWKNSNNS